MFVIAALVSIFVAIIGAVTFHTSAADSVREKNYEDVQLSFLMVLVGVFCLVFNLADITSAVAATVFVGIIMFVVYGIIAYTSGAYSFEAGKAHRNEMPVIADIPAANENAADADVQ